MLRFRLRGQTRRVGRQKSERRFGVFAILGQVEMDAADQIPGRILLFEEILNGALDSANSERNAVSIRSRASATPRPSDTPHLSSAVARKRA